MVIAKNGSTKLTTKGIVRAEGHSELAPVQRNMTVRGLEEIPTNMIPIPFYKLVQPGSTNVSLSDGNDATTGTFYRRDIGEAVPSLKFALLRAKRQTRVVVDDRGEEKGITTLGILGMNLDKFTPFILGISVASFSNFGRLCAQFKEKGNANAWDYPVVATTEKKEETKIVNGKPQKVKYWVVNFKLEKEMLEENTRNLLTDAYDEFAASLDPQLRQEGEHQSETAPKENIEVPMATEEKREGTPF